MPRIARRISGGLTLLACLAASYGPALPAAPATIFLSQDQEVQLAREAAPEHLRAQATVYVFEEAGYREIRAGTNGFTCLVNRDGNQAGDNDLKPTCWDPEGSRTIVPVMLRVGELIAAGASAELIKQEIDTGFASGKYSSPRQAGIAYMLKGHLVFDPNTRQITRRGFPPHYMIYSPGVSNADIGMDAGRPVSNFSLPMVYAGYSGGARTAYIIVLAAPPIAHGH